VSEPQLVTQLPAIQSATPADPMLALVERAARDPGVDVEKMERLLAMAERLNAQKAKTEYAGAMNRAQLEMRPVANDSDNPQTRSRYASYGALDRAVRPIYTAHGFSLSFGTKATGTDRIIVTCEISHSAGHTREVEIDMPADGKGAKGGDVMTKTHATGSAVSYGMRYLLKMIFNLAAGEYDDDGNAAGRAPKPSFQAKPPPKPVTPQNPPSRPPVASPPVKKATPKEEEGWAKFLAACKARLLEQVPADLEWAWWRYAVDSVWIFPSQESLADARVEEMFKGFDRANPKESAIRIVEKHKTAVEAFAANCPPELRNEILRSAVPMLAGKTTQAPEAKQPPPSTAKTPPNAFACPNCKGTTTKPHEDYEAVMWCQKCGWQWDGAGVVFEAHPWMFAKLPFFPKDPAKKAYRGMTLGQLARIDNPYWFGIVKNFEAKPFNGKPPSDESVKFGEACALAKAHLEEGARDDSDLDSELDNDDAPY
jgi:ribosomal protein L37AE/L43A